MRILPIFRKSVSRLALLMVSASPAAFAAEAGTGSLFGRVEDSRTGRPVAGCKVRVYPADTAVLSDSLGRFALEGLTPGIHRALFMKSGYEPLENANVVVGTGMAEEVMARLAPSSQDTVVELAELTARGRGRGRNRGNEPAGTFRYGRNDVLRAPGALGDISMFAQTLPGVSRTSDQATDLAVRGGGPDENAFLIDGIPIFNINHFEDNGRAGGGIGNINTYFLDDVEFHTGAFSARYPDRLSAVMDISFKRGNPRSASGMGTADVAGLGGLLEGPIPGSGGRGTYGATARLSALTFLDRMGLIDFGGIPRYGNGHLKLNWEAGGWDYSVNVLGGVDDYEETETYGPVSLLKEDTSARYRGERNEALYTGNVFGGLRATRKLERGKLSLYGAGNFREYEYREEFDNVLAGGGPAAPTALSNGGGEESGGTRILWGADADRFLTPAFTLRAGLLHEYDLPEKTEWRRSRAVLPGRADSAQDFRLVREGAFYTLGAYAEAAWKRGPWDLAAGARLLYDEYTTSAFAGPRLSARRQLGSHAFKAAFGAHTQSQAGPAFGRGVPEGTGRLPYNLQTVLGWDASLPFGVSARLELFDKQAFRLLRFRADGTARDTGTTVSRGVDLMVRKALRAKAWGAAAYTFAWNREEREGEWEKNAYSVPHTFSTSLGYDFSRRFTASVKLGLASGSPYTRPDTAASATGPAPLDPSRRYAETAEAYLRLDARAEYRHAFPRATLGLFLEITNLTDEANLFAEEEFFLQPGWGFLPIGGLTLSF